MSAKIPPQLLHAPIILLKEGTDTSQGLAQIISNINACQALADIVRSTLGPRGMDKLIAHGRDSVTITNDGATVLDLLDIVHPAAKVLVDISKAQDDEVGDGTTSVVVLAGELLSEAKSFLEDGIAPRVVIRGFQVACQLAINRIQEIQISLADKSLAEKRQLLERCAQTTLSSKLISECKEHFAKMVVDAVLTLETSGGSGAKDEASLSNRSAIGIKKITGGSVTDSCLIEGVAFKKTFSYAGFEQQPKSFEKPEILLLNLELELKAEKENAEIRIENPGDYQAMVDAEWKIIYEKLDAIVKTGAKIVLSRLPIGDLATQYFADRNIFCAGRVEEGDLKRTARATGAQIQTTAFKIGKEVLGTCGKFEEIQIGSERYNILKDCPGAKSVTIILRGGAHQFIDEAERSIHDAIMVVRRAVKTNAVVAGGGAIEMELSRALREHSRRSIAGKQQLIVNAFAKALECIPRALAVNSALDQTDILNKLRQKHSQAGAENRWYGVNCLEGGICDAFESFIWEPSLVKSHAIQAATQAACVVLSIDETVKNPKSNPDPQPQR